MTKWLKLCISLSIMLLPIVVFYSLLWKNLIRVPFLDDYGVLLKSANRVTACPDIRSRILALVTYEYNGYKLVLEYSSVLVEHLEAGYISIVSLVQVGNVIPLLIFIMICLMARLPQRAVADKIIVLAPVAYFILQLQHAEALDFASCSLQVLGVVFFSLLSIYLLGGGSSLKFTLACASLVLAVASSPNGFFLMPVGCLLLAQRRRWAGAITWAVLTLLMLSVYMFHYLPFSTNESRPSATYALSFLGSAAAGYQSKLSIVMSISLGAVFFAVAVTAFIRRYHKRNPCVLLNALYTTDRRRGVQPALGRRCGTKPFLPVPHLLGSFSSAFLHFRD